MIIPPLSFLPVSLSPSMPLILSLVLLPLCLFHILLWNAFPSFSSFPLHFPVSPFHIMVLQDLVTIGDDASIDDASLIAHINTRGIYRLNPLSVGKGCVLKSGTRYSAAQGSTVKCSTLHCYQPLSRITSFFIFFSSIHSSISSISVLLLPASFLTSHSSTSPLFSSPLSTPLITSPLSSPRLSSPSPLFFYHCPLHSFLHYSSLFSTTRHPSAVRSLHGRS